MDEHPILVGYDGTAGSGAALRWALNEAVRRGVGVRLVRVLDQRQGDCVPEGSQARAEAEMFDEAKVALDKVGAYGTTEGAGAVRIACAALVGPVVDTLCGQSRQASMAVLGNRGMGGLAGLLLGSVSVAVAAHAPCPVVVVREDMASAPGGPVVVGVDGSDEGRIAVEFAFAEASTRGVALDAVHVVPPPRPAGKQGHDAPVDISPLSARGVLEAALHDCRTRYPRVRVNPRVLPGAPGQVLAGASREAQLLVVGSRGRGGFHGLILGSVSQHVLHRARCPVAVVRQYPGTPPQTSAGAGTEGQDRVAQPAASRIRGVGPAGTRARTDDENGGGAR